MLQWQSIFSIEISDNSIGKIFVFMLMMIILITIAMSTAICIGIHIAFHSVTTNEEMAQSKIDCK